MQVQLHPAERPPGPPSTAQFTGQLKKDAQIPE
jgi:hypothetical protein